MADLNETMPPAKESIPAAARRLGWTSDAEVKEFCCGFLARKGILHFNPQHVMTAAESAGWHLALTMGY